MLCEGEESVQCRFEDEQSQHEYVQHRNGWAMSSPRQHRSSGRFHWTLKLKGNDGKVILVRASVSDGKARDFVG